jgi:sugar/nucleoside kinase (ribokinase family)
VSLAASIAAARLCVVGNLNRDLRAAPIAPGPRLLRDGETSTASVAETIGGGGANSAISAAALGARTTLAARVGADELGDRLDAAMQARGVLTRLARSSDAPTGTSLALAFDGGHRHFVSCLPSSRQLAERDLPDDLLDGQHHLLRADIWFSEPMLFGGNRRLFARARAAGVATSIDLNWDPAWGSASARERERRLRAVREALPLVDLAHGNARELCAVTGCRRLERALTRLSRWGCGAVVVHLGARGAGWWQDGELIVEPATRPSRIVNQAGTGDLLSVIMILTHRSGAGVRERLRYANRTVAAYMEGRALKPQPLAAASRAAS